MNPATDPARVIEIADSMAVALEAVASCDEHRCDAGDALQHALRVIGNMRALCDYLGRECSHRLLRPECKSDLQPPIKREASGDLLDYVQAVEGAGQGVSW